MPHWYHDPVVKPKFVCPVHSEAKQTKQFGAVKGLLQGPSKENGLLVLKRPKLPDGFQGGVFKGKIGCGVGGSAGFVTFL